MRTKKATRVLGFVVLAVMLVMFGGMALGADREQFSVTELSIGDPLVQVTATGTELNALDNSGSGGTVSNAANVYYGKEVTATNKATFKNVTVTGTLTGSVVSSNATGTLTTSNLTANGLVTIAGTATFTGVPAVDIAVSIATNANGGTNVVVCTAKDKSGATIAQKTAFRLWIGDTDGGVPAAVDSSFTVSAPGIELQEVVDKADYWIVTGANGIVTNTICDVPGATNYVHTAVGGGAVRSTKSAYNLP